MRISQLGGFGSLFVLGMTILCEGADPPATTLRDRAFVVTTEAAKSYEFELQGEVPEPLRFHKASLLRWSNPVAGEVFGNVFVWTRNGRPEVIGSLHQWISPLTHGSHEFHSLATSPIVGKRDGKRVWLANQKGIQLKQVPGNFAVADQLPARLRQMRSISRQFTVHKTDREGTSRDLRLLAQPIYRYPSNEQTPILDGAMFVFVQGTDPEVFLLLETRMISNELQWQYAFARMNSVTFVAKHLGQTVWSVETWPWSKAKNGSEVYTQFGPFKLPALTSQ